MPTAVRGGAGMPPVPVVGVGSLLRAPGLAVLAVVSLIEGYHLLGVVHVGSTAVGAVVFGTAGVALVALVTPAAAAVLTSGARSSGRTSRLGGLVVGVASAVTVVTGTALVIGGQTWHRMAGATDLVLAAAALAAVVVGERVRNHDSRVVGERLRSRSAVDGPS